MLLCAVLRVLALAEHERSPGEAAATAGWVARLGRCQGSLQEQLAPSQS
jgi:hypothetical protein